MICNKRSFFVNVTALVQEKNNEFEYAKKLKLVMISAMNSAFFRKML